MAADLADDDVVVLVLTVHELVHLALDELRDIIGSGEAGQSGESELLHINSKDIIIKVYI